MCVIYIYIYMYIYIHIHTYTYMCIYTYICVCICIMICISLFLSLYIYTYICIYICTHTYTYIGHLRRGQPPGALRGPAALGLRGHGLRERRHPGLGLDDLHLPGRHLPPLLVLGPELHLQLARGLPRRPRGARDHRPRPPAPGSDVRERQSLQDRRQSESSKSYSPTHPIYAP